LTEVSDILNAVSIGEEVDWEFKSARGGLPGSLWETYSAMANSDGGVIVLGVTSKDEVYFIDGIESPEKQRKEIWDLLNNRGKISINLLVESDVQVKTVFDKKIISIHVPRAARRQRPIYVGQNPLLGTYRRNYEGDYRCTEDEVGRMLADKAEEPADGIILQNFGLKDLDEESLKSYRQRFASRSPDHPWLNEDTKEFLIKLGGWRIDRKSNEEGLTIAGLLMFGRMESIKDPLAVSQYHVDYREKLSEDSNIRWIDRITLDGTWPGNLFQFYLKVMQRLSKDLKIPFQLSSPGLTRKDDTVVHEAIREALTNAMIHADYRGQGGIVIDRFPDRIEMSNPGSLLISREQIRAGGISECRNKSLQLMFQMIGLGEKAGSGIDKIITGWKSQNWRPPGIREQFQPDRIKLILPMVSLIPDGSSIKLRQLFGDNWDRLVSEERLALAIADTEGDVSNVRLQEVSDKHPADLTKRLQNLVKRGFLVSDGRRRWSRYKLPSSPEAFDFKGESGALAGSLHKESSTHKDSIHKEDSSHKGLTQNETTQLKLIAASALERKRLPPEQLKKIILELCRERFLTMREIASLINRNESAVRSRFLRVMVREGLMELRFPNKVNAPNQAYRTRKNHG